MCVCIYIYIYISMYTYTYTYTYTDINNFVDLSSRIWIIPMKPIASVDELLLNMCLRARASLPPALPGGSAHGQFSYFEFPTF